MWNIWKLVHGKFTRTEHGSDSQDTAVSLQQCLAASPQDLASLLL